MWTARNGSVCKWWFNPKLKMIVFRRKTKSNKKSQAPGAHAKFRAELPTSQFGSLPVLGLWRVAALETGPDFGNRLWLQHLSPSFNVQTEQVYKVGCVQLLHQLSRRLFIWIANIVKLWIVDRHGCAFGRFCKVEVSDVHFLTPCLRDEIPKCSRWFSCDDTLDTR